MRKGYGIYLYSLLLCILVFYFQGNHRGYAKIISDWRGVQQVDYSTNAVVCNYYGGKSKWLRGKNWQEIQDRLQAGESLLFGIDYYALYPISRPLVPVDILKQADPHILRGKVVVYKIQN